MRNKTKPVMTYGFIALLTAYGAFTTVENIDVKESYELEKELNTKLLDASTRLSDEKDTLEKQLQDKTTQSEKRGSLIADLKERIAELEDKNTYLHQELETLKLERDDLRLQVQKLKATPAPASTPPVEKQAPTKTSHSTQQPSTLNFQATAYVATGNPTASGVMPSVGRTIATDPSVIPMGSKVQINIPSHPQYNGIYVAEDTGGAINGNIIDLFVAGHAEAVAFGRQPIHVKIISTPS